MNSLDIIIPVYNSDKQLLSTLFSIGYFPEYNIKNIIIIDDCSNCNNDYQKSIDIFSSYLSYLSADIATAGLYKRELLALEEYLDLEKKNRKTIWNILKDRSCVEQ